MKTYIHYGAKAFMPELFVPIQNRYFVKPHGGLWASPTDAKYGWKEWNKDSGFIEIIEDRSFKFTLTEDAKVLHIYSVSDLDVLPKLEIPGMLNFNIGMVYLDFEALMEQGYDAIELHLSEEDKTNNGFMEGLYWNLYGWDCDSILVMNPDIVVV